MLRGKTKEIKVVTGRIKLDYIHLAEPYSPVDGVDPRYSATIIIPNDDYKTVQAITEAVNEAKELWKIANGGNIPGALVTPLRDGDLERPGIELYSNSYFLSANSKAKPFLVDKTICPLEDPGELYNGCYARVSLEFYPYINSHGNRGIACGIKSVQQL